MRDNRQTQPWWATEFGSQYLTTYQNKILPKQTAVEINFIIQSLHLDKRDVILDLGCGYGRHTIALSKKGFTVMGIDYSEPLIKAAQKKTESMRTKPVFLQGDMRKLPYAGRFTVILSLFTSFGYFNHKENIQSLKKMYTAMKKDGRLLLDVINTEKYVSDMKTLGTQTHPGVYTRSNEFHKGTLHFYNKNTYYEKKYMSHLQRSWTKGKLNGSYDFYIKRYSVKKLTEMLEEVGFHVEEKWGEFENVPWSSSCGRTIILATKGKRTTRYGYPRKIFSEVLKIFRHTFFKT